MPKCLHKVDFDRLTAKGEKGLCQRRFWKQAIRDQQDLAAHVRYCWINPVKHSYVRRVSD